MNFSDEEYVRLYTTDTITWDTLPWQALALLPLALRKFDRSGVFDFGKHGAERALATKTKLPADVVAAGLRAILDEEIWTVEGTRIYWPTYIEAQNCRRSERLRKRLERSRRASDQQDDQPDSSRPATPDASDKCHVSGGERDIGHVLGGERDKCPHESHSVTPGEAGRGRGEAGLRSGSLVSGSDAREPADPIGPVGVADPGAIDQPQLRALPPVASDQGDPATPVAPPVSQARPRASSCRDPFGRTFDDPTAARALFDAHWSAVGKSGPAFDLSASTLFLRLAHEGVTVSEVQRVVAGARLDDWARDKVKFSPSAILSTAEQRAKYIELAASPPKPKGTKVPPQPNDERNRYKPRAYGAAR